ncbi:MAG: hypothetical protein LIO59_01010 [Oscillospiraceae bacterium]|nr:hypothetical protein [Oscillospiraceae bacterium]
MGIIIIAVFIFGVFVLSTNPQVYVDAGERPDNMLGEVAVWAAGIVILIRFAAFVIHKIYRLIKYKIMKRPDDEVDSQMIIKMTHNEKRRKDIE